MTKRNHLVSAGDYQRHVRRIRRLASDYWWAEQAIDAKPVPGRLIPKSKLRRRVSA